MVEKSGDDMIIKIAAGITIIGILVANGLLVFGGASKDQFAQLGATFHEFAVSADARLRVVENEQFRQREQLINEQASYNDLKAKLDQIEQASRATLAPNRAVR